ncbi:MULTISPECIES: integration host factor, actinobacterial type [unclassified Schaalia]|uniref:integration host factor, actinobacterial type n=1 Tax=unclassified Schaalia TaxID=2691889 RepID=UPI001E3EF503|nr:MULTISPECIES: integration host factor, actinobacterial type [unclassified Schaalia]MCD4549550.1 integration host factor MihF [Schaalia sp. lx-260]MCD4558179.1 integration host factor MihF [Schaalia sp. lx-100]
MAALPDLTPQQRAEALVKATAARRRRAEVKIALKSRHMTFSEVLDLAQTDEALAKMKVVTLLESLPRVGVNTAAQIMTEVGIAPSRRVRGLGSVQREALIARFG